MKKVLAVDFDGCLCTDEYPKIGEPILHNIDRVKMRKNAGWDIVLWTNREGNLLDEAVQACENWGLKFTAINESTPEWIEHYGTSPRKIGATEYWDNRAVCVSDGCHFCRNLCEICSRRYNCDTIKEHSEKSLSCLNPKTVTYCEDFYPEYLMCPHCGRLLFYGRF